MSSRSPSTAVDFIKATTPRTDEPRWTSPDSAPRMGRDQIDRCWTWWNGSLWISWFGAMLAASLVPSIAVTLLMIWVAVIIVSFVVLTVISVDNAIWRRTQ